MWERIPTPRKGMGTPFPRVPTPLHHCMCVHCNAKWMSYTITLNAQGIMWLCAALLIQRPSQFQKTASEVRSGMSIFHQGTQGVSVVKEFCQRLLQNIWARSRMTGCHHSCAPSSRLVSFWWSLGCRHCLGLAKLWLLGLEECTGIACLWT